MATPSRALVTGMREDEAGNGWEALLPWLDPVVINTPCAQKIWKKLDRGMVFWLGHTVAPFPWLNHLALASMIYSDSGAAHPQSRINTLHSFLRWAIPAHYPEVASLKPVEALMAYFGDPPQRRGQSACDAYHAIQLHMQDYLESLPPEERTKLAPFLLPFLRYTPPIGAALPRHSPQGRRETQGAGLRGGEGPARVGRDGATALRVAGRFRCASAADCRDGKRTTDDLAGRDPVPRSRSASGAHVPSVGSNQLDPASPTSVCEIHYPPSIARPNLVPATRRPTPGHPLVLAGGGAGGVREPPGKRSPAEIFPGMQHSPFSTSGQRIDHFEPQHSGYARPRAPSGRGDSRRLARLVLCGTPARRGGRGPLRLGVPHSIGDADRRIAAGLRR